MIILLVGQFAVGELLLKLGARVDRRLGALGREGVNMTLLLVAAMVMAMVVMAMVVVLVWCW